MQNLLESALQFITRYNYIFYIFGALGLLFYLNRARAAQRQMRITPFPIEREEASANVRDAMIIAVIFAAILGATFYIDRVLLAEPGETDGAVAVNGDNGNEGEGGGVLSGGDLATPQVSPTATSPAIGPTPEMSPTPTSEAQPTDTADTAATETPGDAPTGEPPSPTPEIPPTPELPPTEVLPTPTETVEETPTVAPSPIPTQVPQPTAPPVPAASCQTPGVQIASPGNGAVVSGALNISGTADIPNFQFYKMEYSAGTNQNSFSSIGDIIAAPVNGGRLMTWNTGGFPDGIYALRLTVVDVSGNFPPPCTIFVIVQ